jgi:drug/metabolite transporter superfamily protein YnfA
VNQRDIQTRNAERTLWGLSLILAPALFAVSTFLWVRTNGRVEYGAIGGVTIALATVFWIPAFIGLFDLLKDRMPRYATWGLLVAIYGCVGGAAFGLEGLFAEAFRISHDVRRAAWIAFPTPFNLTFFWPGSLFPLSLLILGAMLIRTRSLPLWTGVLICLAAIAFPISRIPRIALVAHAADVLMLVPLAHTGFGFLKSTTRS